MGIMLSMMECLGKAAEMDARAAHCETRDVGVVYLELGQLWRQLAVRALRQDLWAFENLEIPFSN